MKNDPIVREVRRIRHKHAARFKFDLDLIVEDFKTQEQVSGRSYVTLPSRRLKQRSRGETRWDNSRPSALLTVHAPETGKNAQRSGATKQRLVVFAQRNPGPGCAAIVGQSRRDGRGSGALANRTA